MDDRNLKRLRHLAESTVCHFSVSDTQHIYVYMYIVLDTLELSSSEKKYLWAEVRFVPGIFDDWSIYEGRETNLLRGGKLLPVCRFCATLMCWAVANPLAIHRRWSSKILCMYAADGTQYSNSMTFLSLTPRYGLGARLNVGAETRGGHQGKTS